MTSVFSSLPLRLRQRLAQLGIRFPTTIQSLALPVVLCGSDVVITAETGSGKTVLYALPAVMRWRASLESPGPQRPGTIIMSPTHELCRQIDRVIRSFDEEVSPILLQKDELRFERPDRTKPHSSGRILIGTPTLLQNVYRYCYFACFFSNTGHAFMCFSGAGTRHVGTFCCWPGRRGRSGHVAVWQLFT